MSGGFSTFVDAEPPPNVILEFQDRPGDCHLEVYIPMRFFRPPEVVYQGRAFFQSRQMPDGRWVYRSI